MNIELTLTKPQDNFVFSEQAYPLFVGGFGSGKSEALFKRLLLQKLAYPRLSQGYFAPTHDLIKLIAFPRIANLLDELKLDYRLNKTDKIFKINGFGEIICRSMSEPDSIVGFEIADAVIDELDTLGFEHAQNAWNKIIARCRQNKPDGKLNTTAVGTTPEGFRFCYHRWVKNGGGEYKMYQAPTTSNPYLPPGYIDGLRATYDPQLLNAYLNGQFVNLASGSVYPDFDRHLNHTDETIQQGDTLHIGMDFNVLNMAAIVHVIRGDIACAVDEIIGARDTPTICQIIQSRYPNHQIIIYPDASGHNTSSKSSSLSDHSILRQYGFKIKVASVNPSIKDRVNAMNAMIHNSKGQRRYLVNTRLCSQYTECLEQQVYDKSGMPDKMNGHDHANDAGGYFVAYTYPITKPVLQPFIQMPY